MLRKANCVLIFAMLSMATVAFGAPTIWDNNNHFYEIISKPITWEDANIEAAGLIFNGLQGHLATITSADENIFLTYNAYLGNGLEEDLLQYHWIGGFQPDGSVEPDGGWSWVTGETFSYNNWGGGGSEPNDIGDEKYIGFDHGFSADGKEWNDLPGLWDINDPDSLFFGNGYIVEYEKASTVPAPGTAWLLGSGLLGLIGISRRQRS